VKGAAVAALILLGVAWYVLDGRVRTDDAQVDCHITAVAPQVPGYVVKLFINDNTPVKEGDVLVQIDPRTYQAEVDQAQANLDFAEAQANSAKLQIGLTRQTTSSSTTGASAQKDSDAADYVSSQAQLEQSATANLQLAEANVAARQATNERAQADLARYTPLLVTDDVSKFQFDSVEAAARVATSSNAPRHNRLWRLLAQMRGLPRHGCCARRLRFLKRRPASSRCLSPKQPTNRRRPRWSARKPRCSRLN
jgi:membrane fusion protein (multidrug efflux system)